MMAGRDATRPVDGTRSGKLYWHGQEDGVHTAVRGLLQRTIGTTAISGTLELWWQCAEAVISGYIQSIPSLDACRGSS